MGGTGSALHNILTKYNLTSFQSR